MSKVLRGRGISRFPSAYQVPTRSIAFFIRTLLLTRPTPWWVSLISRHRFRREGQEDGIADGKTALPKSVGEEPVLIGEAPDNDDNQPHHESQFKRGSRRTGQVLIRRG